MNLNTDKFQIIAGQPVIDAMQAHKEAHVKRSWGDTWESESLCQHQREMSRRGYLGAEIVKSIYGHSLRYDNGLQNFGLIAGARQIGGTYEAAVAYAQAWVAADPEHRYAWVRR